MMNRLMPMIFGCVLLANGEVYDRLAVSVGNEIITEREVLLSMRTAAFLDGEPIVITPEGKRSAAQKLVELTLIRLEIEANRYPAPSQAQVDRAFLAFKEQRFGQDEPLYRQSLAEYAVSEASIRESLKMQLVTLSFIEFRFRPAVQIPEEELRDFYEFSYLPEAKRLDPNSKPPEYLELRSSLIEMLTQQRIDNLLDRWISQTESQTRVLWNPSVFDQRSEP